MFRELTSATNSLVKVFRDALSEGVTRDGWLAVEGPRLLEEALDCTSGRAPDRCQVHTALVRRSAAERFATLIQRLPREAEVVQVPDAVFDRLALTETPQGIAALVELPSHTLEAAVTRRDACLLIACGIQDPGNMGSMIRSAQALGATAVLAMKETVSPFNPKAVRSSAGAIFRLPVFRNLQADELFARLRSAGVTIIAADRHSSDSLASADLRSRAAFLIGKEATGVDESMLRETGLRLSIPIRANINSVNAGVAAGIFLYEAARQRGFKY